MLRKAAASLVLVVSLVALTLAASPIGRWEGLIGGPAQLNVNYTFAVEGERLDGTIDLLDHGASFPIDGGVVKGDSLSFTVDFAGMAVLSQRGRVAGDTLYLWSHFGDGNEMLDVFTRRP